MACRVPLQAREVDIIKRMKRVLKLPIKQIARCVGRHKKTVYKALKTRTLLRRGCNEVLTTKQVRHMVSILRCMVKYARARFEVTLAMLKKKAKVKACGKTVRKTTGMPYVAAKNRSNTTNARFAACSGETPMMPEMLLIFLCLRTRKWLQKEDTVMLLWCIMTFVMSCDVDIFGSCYLWQRFCKMSS
jgi:hypothetical protein